MGVEIFTFVPEVWALDPKAQHSCLYLYALCDSDCFSVMSVHYGQALGSQGQGRTYMRGCA